MASKRSSRIIFGVAAGLAALVAIGLVILWPQIEQGSRDSSGGPQIGGPFNLVDQTGAPVTDKSWPGAYRLIYFGYTFCPDACPTELQVMAEAIDDLGPDGARVQPIFITIDPARDTPKQLAAYVPEFHPRLVGLTGTAEQIAQAARAYKVYYAKADDSPSYAMNHSSFVYLMGPDGRFITVFSSDTDPEKMAGEIKAYIGG
jgi:protein SCO1/2